MKKMWVFSTHNHTEGGQMFTIRLCGEALGGRPSTRVGKGDFIPTIEGVQK